MHNLLLYGGTFDPVHNAHINTAINVQSVFNFDQFAFLPCKIPVLKNNAIASSQQRIDMLNLAITETKDQRFYVDLAEINRDTPSYMFDTLNYFRRQLGKKIAITVLMGIDTFYLLPQWFQWQELLNLANLLVIDRINKNAMPILVKKLLLEHEISDPKIISTHANGFIYRFNAGQFDLSSTWIRQQLYAGKDMSAFLPRLVLDYIKSHQLYSMF